MQGRQIQALRMLVFALLICPAVIPQDSATTPKLVLRCWSWNYLKMARTKWMAATQTIMCQRYRTSLLWLLLREICQHTYMRIPKYIPRPSPAGLGGRESPSLSLRG